MISMMIRKIWFLENRILCFILFCDDLSDDSKKKSSENRVLCILLICDDLSEGSKKVSSKNCVFYFYCFVMISVRIPKMCLQKIVSYVLYCLVMISVMIRQRFSKDCVLCFILFCDDFSDDSEKKTSENRVFYIFLIFILFNVLYYFVMILVRIPERGLQKIVSYVL